MSRARPQHAPSRAWLLEWLGGCSILAIAVALVYWPAYHAEFLNYDDPDYVTINRHVTSGLTADNVAWAFTNAHASNWHPLTWISHMIDVELFGLDPRGHHMVNVALHAINAALLFAMLASLTGAPGPSFVAAGLFALHPLNVESVAWIAQRKTTLATLFGILSIWAYGRAAHRRSRPFYAASVACCALSLASKALFVTLPLALILLDFWPLRRFPENEPVTLRGLFRGAWRLLPGKLPYLALAVAASAIALATQTKAMQSIESYPLGIRLGNVAIAYVRYLALLIWPANLAAFYPLDEAAITWPKVAGALVSLAALTATAWYLRGLRYPLVGWLWYLGTMVPMVGLVHVGMQSMADRYLYLPAWGLFLIVAWGGRDMHTRIASKSPQHAAAAAVVALLALLGWATHARAAKWHDTMTLFEDAVAHTTANAYAHRALSDEYIANGDYARALDHCRRGLAATRGPGAGPLLSNYGMALFESGETDEAIARLEQAIAALPSYTLAYVNLGWIYVQSNRHDLAESQFAAAAQTLTEDSTQYARRSVYHHWGRSLAMLGRFAEAQARLETAVQVDPAFAPLLCDAAAVDLQLGDRDRAIERLQRALQLDPTSQQARLLLNRAGESPR